MRISIVRSCIGTVRHIGKMLSLRNLVKLAVVMWFATHMNAAEAFTASPNADAVSVPSHMHHTLDTDQRNSILSNQDHTHTTATFIPHRAQMTPHRKRLPSRNKRSYIYTVCMKRNQCVYMPCAITTALQIVSIQYRRSPHTCHPRMHPTCARAAVDCTWYIASQYVPASIAIPDSLRRFTVCSRVPYTCLI